MLQLKAAYFAPFWSLYQLRYPPNFSDSCESPIGRSSPIFRMISFKELKIYPNNTTKINEFGQIWSNYATFTANFAPKAAHHQIWHLGKTHWSFQKGMTNLVLWKFSQSLENNGTKIFKIRASLFLSCTSYYSEATVGVTTWYKNNHGYIVTAFNQLTGPRSACHSAKSLFAKF